MSAPPAVPPGLARREAPAEAGAPGASRRRSDGGASASRGGRGGGNRGRRASAAPTPPASAAPYAPHLEPAAAAAAVAAGGLFRAVLRCNPGDRAQAFCTVAGLPADVFVRGEGAQNRAVEGDEVALRLLPPAVWHQPTAKHGGGGSTRSTPAPDSPSSPVAPGAGYVKPFRRGAGAAAAAAPTEDLLAAPALQASASGGDLGVDFSGGGGREGEDVEVAVAVGAVELAGGEDAGGAARGGGGGDDGAPHSMAAFLAASFAAAAGGGSPAAAAAPAAEEEDEGDAAARPWERAGGPEAAAARVAELLGGAYVGWRATGEVVAILSPSPRRAVIVGVLTARGHGLLLTPTNPRLPALKIKPAGLAALTAAERGALAAEAAAPAPPPGGRTLVRAALRGWDAAAARPHGAVEALLGRAGALDAAVRALLDAEGVVDDDTFTPEILACLPHVLPWAASPADRAGRRDLRALRAFSIDPPTARDLDDALSVERLGGGALRVGVHIADVAHFVRPGTALDAEAATRATSTYLVDRVVPMLPRPLCEDACSLNPGAERLAFSVVWVMGEEDAVIRETWVGRTLINSCAKLSYPQVQAMLEGEYLESDASAGAPPPGAPPLHGPHAWADVRADCLALGRLAAALRRRRFEERGALRLDNARLAFRLDPASGAPVGFEIYPIRESNRLVEEFMLLANCAAADVIAAAYPEQAVLRRHPAPAPDKMAELAEALAALAPGAPRLAVGSAGALHASLGALAAALGPGSPAAEAATLLCTKPMQLARYFSAGELPPAAWAHYALAVPRYTHFTSPIRRYPDVLVHRALAAAVAAGVAPRGCYPDEAGAGLGGGAGRGASGAAALAAAAARFGLPAPAEAAALAAAANARRAGAKAAQDGALRLYLAAHLLEQPVVVEAVVLALGGSRFFDAYVPALGADVRVHTAATFAGGEGALRWAWRPDASELTLDRKRIGDRPTFADVPGAGGAGERARGAGGGAPPPRAPLPLTLRPLGAVPLLVGARRDEESGGVAGLVAKLWVE